MIPLVFCDGERSLDLYHIMVILFGAVAAVVGMLEKREEEGETFD